MGSALVAVDIFIERSAGVVPVQPVIVVFGVDHPRPLRVEVSETASLAQRNIDVTEHRHQPPYVEAVAWLGVLDMSHGHLAVLEHEVHILLQQYVGVHEQESVWQQLHEFLDAHHVAVGCPPVGGGGALVVASQLHVEVDVLAFRVVEYRHTLHLDLEWALGAVVEDCHMVVHASMLPDAQDGSLGQFWGVVVDDGHFSFHFLHSLSVFISRG